MRKSLNIEQGSVTSEFAIVLPLLVVFFLGVAGVGQLLGHSTWLAQATFTGAMAGTALPVDTGPVSIEANITTLKDLQSRGQIKGGDAWDVQTNYYTAPSGKPYLIVRASAQVSPITKAIIPMNLGVSVAAPYLVPDANLFANLGTFQNPPAPQGCSGTDCVKPAPYNPKEKPYYSDAADYEKVDLEKIGTDAILEPGEEFSDFLGDSGGDSDFVFKEPSGLIIK